MSLTPELAAKLRPILLLLSSESSGEVAAAAARIGFLLRKNGLDWHDLADQVVAGGVVVAPPPPSSPPPPPPSSPQQSSSVWGPGGGQRLGAEELLAVIAAIRASPARLSANARQFLNDLECRATAYATVRVSERQHDWLVGLAEAAAAKV